VTEKRSDRQGRTIFDENQRRPRGLEFTVTLTDRPARAGRSRSRSESVDLETSSVRDGDDGPSQDLHGDRFDAHCDVARQSAQDVRPSGDRYRTCATALRGRLSSAGVSSATFPSGKVASTTAATAVETLRKSSRRGRRICSAHLRQLALTAVDERARSCERSWRVAIERRARDGFFFFFFFFFGRRAVGTAPSRSPASTTAIARRRRSSRGCESADGHSPASSRSR